MLPQRSVKTTMELAADLRLENAECPVWNPIDARLYFADIPQGRMFRLDPRSQVVELVYEAHEQIGALLVGEDGSIVQGLEGGRVQRWREGLVKTLIDRIPEEQGRRFNDGIVDQEGRMLLGTMPDASGHAVVYCVECDGSYRVLLHGIGQSNGLDFSLDQQTLYATDTRARQILECDYNSENGCIGEKRLLVNVQIEGAVPDGLEVDSRGRIWSAMWGGGCCICYSPAGKELFRRELPTPKVSSIAFAGLELDLLFTTTARGQDRSESGEHAGGIFYEQAEAPGRPANLARVL